MAKLATLWTPFDRHHPQYVCHVHGFDARHHRIVAVATIAAGTMFATAGVAVLAHIHWMLVASTVWGLATAPIGLYGAWLTMEDMRVCFPTCTCGEQARKSKG